MRTFRHKETHEEINLTESQENLIKKLEKDSNYQELINI